MIDFFWLIAWCPWLFRADFMKFWKFANRTVMWGSTVKLRSGYQQGVVFSPLLVTGRFPLERNCRISNSSQGCPQLCTCTHSRKIRSILLNFFVAHFGPMNEKPVQTFRIYFEGGGYTATVRLQERAKSNILEICERDKGAQNCSNQMQLGYSGVFCSNPNPLKFFASLMSAPTVLAKKQFLTRALCSFRRSLLW